MNVSKQEVLEAVNLLIKAPNAKILFDSMDATVPLAKQHPVRLSGEAAALNPILTLRLNDIATYDRVMDLVESKRQAAGYAPLMRQDNRFNKTEYMRNFMDQKRERERRAAKIENMIRPASEALKGRARLDFMQRQSAIWKRERDALLERHRQMDGGTMCREKQQQLLDQFWTRIDAELDELETLALNEIRGSGRRKVVNVNFNRLTETLKDQPYH